MGKTAYTKITPLPSNIPRQLALELLHSHEEVIRLNPLVTGVRAVEAPRDAATDEYYSQWYEISQIITWGLGLKSKYSFRGVFHDQPWGLQTHVYAPMGVDMRNKYRIGGNQPGEPREARELGVDTPLDGLYLREDVEISCNVAMISFVKKEAKEATGIMINRLTRKAELLDEGKLHAMFEDGKLKTSRPTNSFGGPGGIGSPGSMSPPGSPGLMFSPDGRLGGGGASPALSHASFGGGSSASVDARGYGKYHDVARRSGYGNGQTQPLGQSGQPGMPMINELPGSTDFKSQNAFRSELPGDVSFGAHPPTGPSDGANHQGQRQSGYVAYPGQAIGTQDSNRLSAATNTTDSWSQPRSSIASSVVPDPSGTSSASSDPAALQQRFGQMAITPEPLHPHPSPGPKNPKRNSYAQPPTVQPSSPTPREHRRQSTSSSTNWSLPLRSPVQTQPPPGFGPGSPGPPQQQSEKKMPITGTASVKCPVCGLFEGDEAAVSHHVSRTHFA